MLDCDAVSDLSPLAEIESEDLQGIDASDTAFSDNDLMHIKNLRIHKFVGDC